MYIKFIFRQILLLILLLISAVFVYPILVYPQRKRLWRKRNNSKHGFVHWFADTYEHNFDTDEKNYLNSFYGVYKIYNKDYEGFKKLSGIRKFFISYKWAVLRNGMWNYIMNNKPSQAKKTNIKEIKNTGGASIWNWRDKNDFGVQHVTWEADGKKYFRYSFTKKFIGSTYINFMAGAEHRYILKFRIFSK